MMPSHPGRRNPAGRPMTGILASLPEPTPAAILAARESAGLSQAQCAALAGLADRRAWWRVEAGERALHPAAWAVFLLSAGLHPAQRVTTR